MKFLDLPDAITSAFESSSTAGLSAEELELQYKKREFISMQKLALELAQTNGMAEGLAKGKAEGKVEGKAEGKAEGAYEAKVNIAIQLLKSGLDLQLISSTTGLSLDEIMELSKNK